MQVYHDWLHFFPTILSLRREKTVGCRGNQTKPESNPGELPPQADTPSITPWHHIRCVRYLGVTSSL